MQRNLHSNGAKGTHIMIQITTRQRHYTSDHIDFGDE